MIHIAVEARKSTSLNCSDSFSGMPCIGILALQGLKVYVIRDFIPFSVDFFS